MITLEDVERPTHLDGIDHEPQTSPIPLMVRLTTDADSEREQFSFYAHPSHELPVFSLRIHDAALIGECSLGVLSRAYQVLDEALRTWTPEQMVRLQRLDGWTKFLNQNQTYLNNPRLILSY